MLKNAVYKKEYEQVEFIEKCFDEGKNHVETAKLLGISCHKLITLKEKYGIKSNLDKAHERLDELAPKLLAEKKSLNFIAKEVGLSKETVSRWIKNRYGKTYLDIRMER